MEQNYCRRCGQALTPNKHGGLNCANNHTLYSNPAPCVGIFLLDTSGNVILGVRGVEPMIGTLDTIGGFVDMDETYEEALAREIQEETGLSPADYSEPTYLSSEASTYDYQDEQRSIVSALYYATLNDNANPRAHDDVAELKRIPLAEVNVNDIGNNDIKKGLMRLKSQLG